MYEVDYAHIAGRTSKVLGRAAKIKSLILPKASPFYAEKVMRLYSSARGLHAFFSSRRIDSNNTLNQVRAYFSAVLLNLQHLETSEYNAMKNPRTRSLIRSMNREIEGLRGAFGRFGI